MFIADHWQDYEVLDTGDGEKLERWKNIVLRRPDPQAIWPKQEPALWEKADAWYHRSSRGGGEWEFRKKMPETFAYVIDELLHQMEDAALPAADDLHDIPHSQPPAEGPIQR